MKSKILLSGLAAALVVSGANAAQYRPVKMSYASQIRPFVGLSIGMQTTDWARQVDKDAKLIGIYLPEDFVSFGAEAGFRFGNYHEIYNGGTTINFDISMPDNIETTISHIRIAEVNTMTISGTYDNYIRLSGDKLKRIDLVLGAGVGAMNERTKWDHVGTMAAFDGDIPADDNDWAGTFVLKVGFDFEITRNIALSANARGFFPVKSNYDIDANIIFGGTVKYVF